MKLLINKKMPESKDMKYDAILVSGFSNKTLMVDDSIKTLEYVLNQNDYDELWWVNRIERPFLKEKLKLWCRSQDIKLVIIDAKEFDVKISDFCESERFPITRKTFSPIMQCVFKLKGVIREVYINTKLNDEELGIIDHLRHKKKIEEVNNIGTKKSQSFSKNICVSMVSPFNEKEFYDQLMWFERNKKFFDYYITHWDQDSFSHELFEKTKSHSLDLMKQKYKKETKKYDKKSFDLAGTVFLIRSSFHLMTQNESNYKICMFANTSNKKVLDKFFLVKRKVKNKNVVIYQTEDGFVLGGTITNINQLLNLAVHYEKILNLYPIKDFAHLIKMNCLQLNLYFDRIL